jgi:hypothetical protein
MEWLNRARSNLALASAQGEGVYLEYLCFNASSLPILEKGEQFPRIICFLLYYVATIKLAYNEFIY